MGEVCSGGKWPAGCRRYGLTALCCRFNGPVPAKPDWLATYDTSTGASLTLGDLFKAGYLDQLSATAVTQLEAGGVPAD